MYNEDFIYDFSENKYNYVLPQNSTPGTQPSSSEIILKESRLKEIADAYIHQYDNPTYLETLAFKESLDHYILRKLHTSTDFKNSAAFKSYCKYLRYIIINRRGEGNRCLECNTNALLNDPEGRKIFLSMFDNTFRAEFEKVKKANDVLFEQIFSKMKRNEHLSQQEMNYLGDYLYTNRAISQDIHKEYVKYLISEMQNNPQISSSPQIVAGFISYMPKKFGRGCEDRRIFFTNGMANSTGRYIISELDTIQREDINLPKNKKRIQINTAYSSGGLKCISIGNQNCQLDLRSDQSLFKSRGFKQKDLYWMAMVCFHELTHQYQKNQIKNPRFNSSGFSQIVRMLTTREDYSNNHDNYEIEIEADETSWEMMSKLILEAQKDRRKAEEQFSRCILNKKAVYGRRTFTTKRGYDDNKYFKHDMELIHQKLEDPNELAYFQKNQKTIPMMQMAFTETGEINSSILFEANIASNDEAGVSANIMGSELAAYILTEKYSSVVDYIKNNDLTEANALHLLQNIYGAYHTEKTYIRELHQLEEKIKNDREKAAKESQDSQNPKTNPILENNDPYNLQYEETVHHFDMTNIREKYLQKFKSIADLAYKERQLCYLIQSKYPTYPMEEYTGNGKYAMWNYQDAFDLLYNHSKGVVEESEVADVIAMYAKTKDPVLTKLALQTKSVLTSSGQATNQAQTTK